MTDLIDAVAATAPVPESLHRERASLFHSPGAVVFLLLGTAAAGTTAFTSPQYGLLITALVVTGAWLATLDSWRRLYALLLISTVCGASNQPALASGAFYPRYVIAAVLVVWTWRTTHDGGPAGGAATRLSRRLTFTTWTLVFVAGASIDWSYRRAVTAQQVVAFAILAALLSTLTRHRWATDPRRIVGDLSVAYIVLIGTFVVSLVLGLAGAPFAYVYGGRLEGVYSNPNTLGDLIGLAIPLGIGLFVSTRRWSYLVMLIPTAFALAQCETRTAIVAAAVGVIWLMIRRGMTRAVRAGLAAIVVIYVGFALSQVLHIPLPSAVAGVVARFNTSGPGGALNSRTVAWHDAITLWEQRPLQGYGFQAGDALFAHLFGNGVITFGAAPAHNSYLQALLELGIVGAIPLLIIFFGAVLPASLYASPAHPGSPFVGVVVAGIATQFTESALFGTGQPYPWVFWLAVAAITCATPDRALRTPGRSLED